MKKVMFALVAAAATAAFAEVTSDVVGYSGVGVNANDLSWKVMTFQNVSTADGKFKLSQINVKGTYFAQENMDYIATINEYGAQDKYYTWDPYYNNNEGAWFECDETVEILDEDTPANDVTLPMNAALFVFSLNGEDLTVSGSVLKGDTALYVAANDLAFTGNFTPALIKLGDLVVPDDFAQENMDYIATIDANGAQGTYYTWDPYYNNNEGAWFECDETVEILDENTPANGVEFDANTAFMIFTLNGSEISIPSPLN